jgi:hypothetical protein
VAKPTNKGHTVSITKLPTYKEIGIDKIVEIKPVIAAPMPAICPIGCIAIERILPQTNPKQKNNDAKKKSKIGKLGLSFPKNNTTYVAATKVKSINAYKANFRIPKRNTNVPFKNVEKPMEIANPAKI